MIQNVIIPEKIGSYYIFPKRIVGIDIGRNEIHATVCYATGSRRTILDLIEEKLENNSNLTYEERVVNALKILKIRLGRYNYIFAAFSSSSIVFKELTLPFLGHKKVKMVVPFEVESLLPFALDTAVVDSIITKEDTKERQTDILVAAVKKEYIKQYISLFDQAGLKIEKLTVDMFELYGLYNTIPSYQNLSGIIALIDIGLNVIRLAIIIDKQLRYIRVLSKGIISAAKKISNILKLDLSEVVQHLIRFGINSSDDEKYLQPTKDVLSDLFHELKFSINAYTSRLKPDQQLNLVILTGSGADIPGIKELSKNIMESDTEIFQAKRIIHNGKISSKVTTIPNSFLVSLATSLAPYITSDFNLYQEKEIEEENRNINQQIIAAAIFVLLIITSFSVYSYLRIRNLRNIVNKAETEAINELTNTFKLKQQSNLKEANKRATIELQKQETAWKQLSIRNRYSLLHYLSELSRCINPQEIQLDLSSILIKNNKIMLYGSVPGYTQLTKLQNQLRCPLFKVPKLQEYNFKADPIVITVKPDEEL